MRLGIRDRGIGGRGSVKDDLDSIKPWEIWMPSLPHGPLQAPPGYAGICEPEFSTHRGGIMRAWVMGHPAQQTDQRDVDSIFGDGHQGRGGQCLFTSSDPFPFPPPSQSIPSQAFKAQNS